MTRESGGGRRRDETRKALHEASRSGVPVPNVVYVLLALSVIVALAQLGLQTGGLTPSVPVPCAANFVLLSLIVSLADLPSATDTAQASPIPARSFFGMNLYVTGLERPKGEKLAMMDAAQDLGGAGAVEHGHRRNAGR